MATETLRGWTLAILAASLAALAWAALRSRRPAAEPRMGFLAHVEDLRRRLLWCSAAILAGMTLAFGFRAQHDAPYLIPALQDNLAAQTYRAVARDLVPDGVQLVVTAPMEALQAELALALALGVAAALPVLWLQGWGFFAPALRPRERRMLRAALFPALTLFAFGALFAYVALVPYLLETLYGYADALGAQPLLRVSQLTSFTATMCLVFGIAFQTPLVMTALGRFGLVSPRAMLRHWRHAFLAVLIAAAFVIDGTPITLALVVGPIMGLYLVGIGGAAIAARNRTDQETNPVEDR